MTSNALLDINMLSVEDAAPEAGDIMRDAQKKFGFSPNMYGYMAALPSLLTTYAKGYSAFRTSAGFSPLEQEAIFLAISQTNSCHYCTAAHSMVAAMVSGVPSDVIAQLRAGELPADPKLHALVSLTREMVESRGRPSQDTLNAFLNAGYTENHVLGIILAISAKVISNYTNYLTDTELDAAFKPYAVM